MNQIFTLEFILILLAIPLVPLFDFISTKLALSNIPKYLLLALCIAPIILVNYIGV